MHAVTEFITFHHKKDCTLQCAHFVLTPLTYTANFSVRAFRQIKLSPTAIIANHQILVLPIFVVMVYIVDVVVLSVYTQYLKTWMKIPGQRF